MTYTVVWLPVAQQVLAEIWLAATDRNAVTRASNHIDQLLRVSPHTLGILQFDTVREYSHQPIGIEFEVDDGNMIVSVLTAWDVATGRPAITGN